MVRNYDAAEGRQSLVSNALQICGLSHEVSETTTGTKTTVEICLWAVFEGSKAKHFPCGRGTNARSSVAETINGKKTRWIAISGHFFFLR